jgi:hypothetical protein
MRLILNANAQRNGNLFPAQGTPAVEAARVFSRVKPRLIGTENVTNSALRVMPEL